MEPSHVRKSVFAIHIVPVKGALSLKARKLQTALARAAGEQYQRLPESERERIESAVRDHVRDLRDGRQPEVPPILYQPRFTAKLRQLAEAVGHDPSDARHLMDDVHRLVGTTVDFNVLGHGSHKEEKDTYPSEMSVRTTLLSSAVKSGRGLVSWGYDPLLLLIMVNPRTYAQLSLELVRNARTYTALALYENVKRFIGIGRAGPYPIRRWQELLSEDGKVPAWENSAEFKRKVRRAQAELEACSSDIAMEMREVMIPGQGRGVEFALRVRPQQALFTEPIPENRALTEDLNKLGFSLGEARHLIDNHGEEYVYAKLGLLRKAKLTGDIRDDKAWLASAIKKDWVDRETEQQRTKAEQDRREKQRRERERLQQEFQELRSQRVLAVYSTLESFEQQELLTAYLVTPGGARAASTLGETSKGFQASFRAWLLEEKPDWLTEDHETDFAAFVLWAKDREHQPA